MEEPCFVIYVTGFNRQNTDGNDDDDVFVP
jgi:hypothetical protein